MDPTGLDEVPEPDRRSHGFDLSSQLKFVPPPEVPIPESANIQARAMALGIDALIWLAAVILFGVIFGGISSSNGPLWINISGPSFLIATILWLAYMTFMEAKHGASIGKRARGLRVVMEDGGQVSPEAALIRNLMRFLDALPYVVPFLVAAVAASRSPRTQRFGDQVAETIVVVHMESSPDTRDAGLPIVRSDPARARSTRRKRRVVVVVAVTLLVVAGGTFLLMRGVS